ncbi:hypothetical protein [uncultured Holdemanella sp.]|jgi:hypothetical protein|uniref:hypothetical protein n=1 Tax=uncultured Holdemanella sp. TaxID=1763549 RepID=UPI0025ED5A38|nr:hypothetical protein [uncultured Holdemanella sp.]
MIESFYSKYESIEQFKTLVCGDKLTTPLCEILWQKLHTDVFVMAVMHVKYKIIRFGIVRLTPSLTVKIIDVVFDEVTGYDNVLFDICHTDQSSVYGTFVM